RALQARYGLGVGKGDGVLHFFGHLGVYRCHLVGGADAVVHEEGRKARQGVLFHPGGLLLLGLVGRGVALEVAALAVGLALEQRRALAGPRPCHGLGGRLVDGQGVVAVNRDAGDVVGRAAVCDVLYGLVPVLAHRNAVVVVLAYEDDGQLPDGGHVERLVEGALVRGAVTEEADADLIRAAYLGGEARARGDAVSRADDAVGAEDALVPVRDVHGAALALAVACLPAEELSHHEVEVATLGNDVAVAPVRAGDEVVVAQAFADGGRYRLLAQVQVDEAGYLALCKQPRSRALEVPYAAHLHIHILHLLFADRHF